MPVVPPPEARLIAVLREKPPRISMRQAAAEAGISPTHWRQIETGVRRFRGESWPETGAAQTIARMALVVDATPEQLREAGRADAAAELEALRGGSGVNWFSGPRRHGDCWFCKGRKRRMVLGARTARRVWNSWRSGERR